MLELEPSLFLFGLLGSAEACFFSVAPGDAAESHSREAESKQKSERERDKNIKEGKTKNENK